MSKNLNFFKLFYILILTLIFIVLIVVFCCENRIFRISNVKYGEIDLTLKELEGKYKSFKFNKVVSFTYLENYESYIKLWSSNSFELEYLGGDKIELIEGRYPNDESEIILNIAMKKGYESSASLKNGGYLIGEDIELNVADYYYEEYFSPVGLDTQVVKAKFDILACNHHPMVKSIDTIYKKYKVVGFYKIILDSENYHSNFLKSSNINALTYEENKNLDDDIRGELIIELKKINSARSFARKKESEYRKKFNRFDESKYETIKTCNDELRYNYLTIRELKKGLS